MEELKPKYGQMLNNSEADKPVCLGFNHRMLNYFSLPM